MGVSIYGLVDGCREVYMDGCTDGWTDNRTDG